MQTFVINVWKIKSMPDMYKKINHCLTSFDICCLFYCNKSPWRRSVVLCNAENIACPVSAAQFALNLPCCSWRTIGRRNHREWEQETKEVTKKETKKDMSEQQWPQRSCFLKNHAGESVLGSSDCWLMLCYLQPQKSVSVDTGLQFHWYNHVLPLNYSLDYVTLEPCVWCLYKINCSSGLERQAMLQPGRTIHHSPPKSLIEWGPISSNWVKL